MNIDERLDRLTARHEALTQTVELIAAETAQLSAGALEMRAEGLKVEKVLRRAVRMAVVEARNQRKRTAILDEKITQIAAAQLVNEELLKRFLQHGGNGHN